MLVKVKKIYYIFRNIYKVQIFIFINIKYKLFYNFKSSLYLKKKFYQNNQKFIN
jgi:hypothetical protein